MVTTTSLRGEAALLINEPVIVIATTIHKRILVGFVEKSDYFAEKSFAILHMNQH